jgi:hypothetical protein
MHNSSATLLIIDDDDVVRASLAAKTAVSMSYRPAMVCKGLKYLSASSPIC